MNRVLLRSIFVVVVSGLLGFTFATLLSTPVIYFSHPDAVCVHVEPPSAGTCDNLPDKYSTQMVSPLWEPPR